MEIVTADAQRSFSVGSFDPQKVQITPTGLILAEGIDFEEWKSIGHYLRNVQKSVEWCIGDWLAYGDWNYRDTVYSKRMPNGVYELASNIFGVAVSTLKNYKWVASKINSSVRADELTLNHGIELLSAQVSESHIPIWIREIEEKGLTTRQLRHRLRDENKDHQTEPGDKPKQTIFGQANKFVIGFVHDSRDWTEAESNEMESILAPVRDWLKAREVL